MNAKLHISSQLEKNILPKQTLVENYRHVNNFILVTCRSASLCKWSKPSIDCLLAETWRTLILFIYYLPIFSTLNNLNCTLLWVFQSSDTNQRTRNPSVVYLIPDRISKAVALLSAIIRKTTTTTKNEHNEIHESSENYSTFSYRSMPDTFGDSISKVWGRV